MLNKCYKYKKLVDDFVIMVSFCVWIHDFQLLCFISIKLSFCKHYGLATIILLCTCWLKSWKIIQSNGSLLLRGYQTKIIWLQIHEKCAIKQSFRTVIDKIIIDVRDQFRLGGLRSVARIFHPLLARKSRGLPENGYLKNSRGCRPPPPPRTPMKIMQFCKMKKKENNASLSH